MSRREMAGAPMGMGHMRVGGSVFAGTMLLVVGFFEIVTGIVGFVRGSWYVLRANYLYEMSVTAWGWLLFGLGVLTVLAGIFAYTGAAAARPVGIGIVGLSILANFFFIPFYAQWSVLTIALGIVALWGLAMSGRRQQQMMGQEPGYGYGAAAPQMGGGQQRWVTTNQPAYGNPEMAGRRAPDMSGTQGQQMPGPMQGQMPGPMQGQMQGRGQMQPQQGMPQSGQHGERRA